MTHLYERLQNREEKLAVIGLGYVGMPLAVAFSKTVDTIGFDVNEEKIQTYRQGIDPTKEVGDAEIRDCTVDFTFDETKLREAKFHVVAVPTPISNDNKPDMTYIIASSKLVGRNLTKGSIVVFESTVYPGATEETCIPILEAESGLVCGVDFKVGYSPERINPGDREHRLETIVKIVAGMDAESLEEIAKVYELVISAGVHRVSSIKVAEAAKVVENSQRDVNIAFMNELAVVFDRMGIDTQEVVEAMNTKWNALGFYPGLVGGHCIGVDPHYFIYEAEKLGYNSQLIPAGRRVNEYMSEFVSDAVIKQLVLANKVVKRAKVAIMGLTFKENCPDIRNSKVVDLIEHLRAYEIEPFVVDPEACPEETKRDLGIDLVPLEDLQDMDCVVFAVAHDSFKEMDMAELETLFGDYPNDEKVVIDVRSIRDKAEIEAKGYRYWRV
ncbi:MAG: nucleotide sugar dehydrogenase [Oscillospiraceae bacterium]|nr:nucleotide sugar dehydrogenase [Oscillospiraceae bacterium]